MELRMALNNGNLLDNYIQNGAGKHESLFIRV